MRLFRSSERYQSFHPLESLVRVVWHDLAPAFLLPRQLLQRHSPASHFVLTNCSALELYGRNHASMSRLPVLRRWIRLSQPHHPFLPSGRE